MRPGGIRTLTPGERALAAEVFAGAIAVARLRVFAIPLWRRAFVPNGRWIVWPGHTARRISPRSPSPGKRFSSMN